MGKLPFIYSIVCNYFNFNTLALIYHSRPTIFLIKTSFFIGIDIGTTNVKAVALDERGQVLAQHERTNRTSHPAPDRSEQNPELLFQDMLSVLRATYADCLAAGGVLEGVAFSAAMHSLIAVDAQGTPLTQVLLWSDRRAAELVTAYRHLPHSVAQAYHTGTPLHPMSPFFKIRWLRENEPNLLQRTHKLLGIKEFIWSRIFGTYVCDYSIASATGLMDTATTRWFAQSLADAGCIEAQLPALVPPQYTERLNAEQAARCGLPIGTPFVIGASDGTLANLGSGAARPDTLVVTIGTSAAVRVTTPHKPALAGQRTFCYLLEAEKYVCGGASNNGANVLAWLREVVFCAPESPETFANIAGQVPAGADGLLFLPHIYGERAPLWDAAATGSFHNITSQHGKAHFIRAVMEGVILNLRLIAELLPEFPATDRVMASGGFSKNKLWVQMLADIFEKPVFLPDAAAADASAVGAVMLGRQALNLPALALGIAGQLILPEESTGVVYREVMAKFEEKF